MPVELNEEDQRLHRDSRCAAQSCSHRRAPNRSWERFSPLRSCCSRRAEIADRLPGRARITTRSDGSSSSIMVRAIWRSLRATRWRSTADPTDLDTTKPTRGPSLLPSSRRTWTTMSGWAARTPRFTVAPKSVDRVIRYCAGSKVPTTRANQAVSERRPLRRRSVTIARPARVRIRSRNPCTRARRRLFGWNVRLPLATAVSPCCVWPPSLHPLSRASTMAVCLSSCVLPSNRRGSHGPSFPRTEDQSGFATVPPTFGRLFEGTDVSALGQTCALSPAFITKIPRLTATMRSVRGAFQPSLRNLSANVAERLALRDKTVSFCQCLFRPGRP
ncbi:hypothetical protein BH11ACT7_BH11ACT7_11640 [soil metagenome]